PFGVREGQRVLPDRLAVAGQQVRITQLLRILRAEPVSLLLGPVEVDGDWIAHVRHHREVDELADVQLVVQPAALGLGVLGEQPVDLTAGRRARWRRRGRCWTRAYSGLPRRCTGLAVLDARELDLVPAALLVPLLGALYPAADDPAEREDQPPEAPDVVEHEP